TNLRNPRHCPSGVYVMPTAENFHTWYGVLFVHKGYYKNGVFKFKLTIPNEYPFLGGFCSNTYPERPPAVQFICNLINNDGLFHPLVNPENGNFSLTQQFKDWAPHKYYIFHVLHYIKKSFKKGVLDHLSRKHCLNEKAFTLYKENPRQFENIARQCAELSISPTVLYDSEDDSNPIQFTDLSNEKLNELKKYVAPQNVERDRHNYSSRRTYSTSSIPSFVEDRSPTV
ncbi:9985_t:CDS:2, partial [Acaulospora morrowiae]